MSEPTTVATTGLLWGLKGLIVTMAAMVEPQLAGILGALAYLIVRHELGMVHFKLTSFLIVIFFGFLGAWATVNLLEEYYPLSHVLTQILSASVGFLSYDAMLSFGKNTNSVISYFIELAKGILESFIQRLKK